MLYSLLVPLLFLVGFAVRKPRNSTFRIGGRLKRTASTSMNPVIGTYLTLPTQVDSNSQTTPGTPCREQETLRVLHLENNTIVPTLSGSAMVEAGASGPTHLESVV